MIYEVRVHRLARFDLHDAYQWAYERAPYTADQWFDRFRETIRTLEASPERCPIAIENRNVPIEIRELHFGKTPNVFRIIFHIDSNIVRVLRIQRGQRRLLTRRAILEAMNSEDSFEA